MFFQLVACTGFVLLLLFPCAALFCLLNRGAGWAQTMVMGCATGLSAAAVGGYYLLLFHVPFIALVLVEYVSLAVATPFLLRRRSPFESRKSFHRLLPALLLVVFVSRAVPLFFGDVPQGLDPCFHSLIAEKIRLWQHLPTDWTPFEIVRLNYPIGMHLLVAEIARWTGAPVHVAFKSLFPVTACLTCLAIYVVAFRFSRDHVAAFFSALAYSFLADWGSLNYYSWGGLPNALGMFLLAASVEALFMKRPALLGLLIAAVVIIHHHSALCLFFLFGGYALIIGFFAREETRSPRVIVIGFAVAISLSAIPVIQYIQAGAEIGRASVLKFYEPLIPLWDGCRYLGSPLVILAALGGVFIVRSEIDEAVLFGIFWLTAFFSLFVFFEYLYRFGVYFLNGEFYTALTPSRFLTNTAGPLSLLAGTALFKLLGHVRSSWRSPATALIVLVSLALAFSPLKAQCRSVSIDRDSFTWIASHAESSAFVASNSPWAPYFTWRETLLTPLPASEARNSEAVTLKRAVLAGGFDTMAEFARKSGRPVYVLQPLQSIAPPGVEEVYHGDQTRILVLR